MFPKSHRLSISGRTDRGPSSALVSQQRDAQKSTLPCLLVLHETNRKNREHTELRRSIADHSAI